MGIIVHKKQERNTELNDRISADLRNRAQQSTVADSPDLAEDSEYVKDLRKTSRFGWIWFVLIALALISLVLIVLV